MNGRAAATPPRLAMTLGLAGLLPQVAAVLVLLGGDPGWRFAALALGYAYAAIILSFLGGLWWGLAAQAGARVPGWLWVASVVPSLVALGSAIPWALGTPWPGPSLGWLGIALLLSLAVDHRLVRTGIAPGWWLQLRVPLSLGLGLLTLAISYLA